MRYQNVYSSKNVITLTIIFCVIFWLVYSIGSFLHESKKISNEIQAMKEANAEIKAGIETKKLELAYLQTPQRIEKEAKMQMGKKQPGEQVLVFIEDRITLLPSEIKQLKPKEILLKVSIPQKWKWVFFGEK
ncbi:MAG TPA: septum formation initiator family protein [Candidatus Gracilibacteria bacterium]